MARKQCTVDDCRNPQNARGFCGKHYARWKKHGDPHAVKYSVQKSARVEEYLSTSTAECRHHGKHSEWKLKQRQDPRGYYYRALECKQCDRQRAKEWREKNPDLYKKSLGSLSATAGRLLSGAKARASKKGLEINITRDWIINQFQNQGGRCALSNRLFQLEYTDGGRRENALSLDQIVPGGGYTKGNTQLVIWAVNEMKKKHSNTHFLDLCCDIAQNRKKGG